MTREQFLERFNQLDAKDQPGLAALAKQVMDDCRAAARAAVDVWSGYDPFQQEKAAHLLAELDELAFVPLTERGDPASPQQRVWMLRVTGNSQLGMRGKFVGFINRMMEDRRRPPARPTPGQTMEVNPPIPRVCDEAYLTHRQFLNSAETRDQYYAYANRFFTLSDDDKDTEIRSLKKTGKYQS
jgi:hypothetical protein